MVTSRLIRVLWLCFYATSAQEEVPPASLRSGALRWHLHWESLRALAETVLREQSEAELLEQFSRLRQQIFQRSPQVWASITMSELRVEIQNAGWPDGLGLLQLAEGDDLHSLGMVTLALRNQLTRLEEDWEQMQKAVSEWNSEAKRSTWHLPVNFEILLKQASVLQGLLQAAPGFDECLLQSLEAARAQRPGGDALYRSAMLYLHTRESTFAELHADVVFDEMLHASKASLEMLARSERPETPMPDWCSGVREVWISGDPCTELAQDFAQLRAEVTGWKAPLEFLRTFSRWQFQIAPNISRLESLTDLLEQAQACTIGSSSVRRNFSVELHGVAADDRASLEEEHHILHRAARTLHRANSMNGEMLGLLGLIKGLLEVQHTIHVTFDEASTWAFRIKSRGNGFQLRLQEVAGRLSSMHQTLKSLPNYRSLAFREIHSAGHWGRKTSGAGSSAQAVSSIGDSFLHFLQGLQRSLDATGPQSLSILDVGCGWGEWLPSMLTKAVKEGSLHENLVYFGIDIAEKPITFLRKSMGSHAFQFEVSDACRDPLPQDFSVAVVRHVFQHLTLADAFSLLRNVYKAKPQLLVLSSWPRSTNEDLHGGSSAFEALNPAHQTFIGFDLRKPPFHFPEPLRKWKEMQGEELLLYPIALLNMPWITSDSS